HGAGSARRRGRTGRCGCPRPHGGSRWDRLDGVTQSPERTREVTRADIEAAREVLNDVARLTPVEGSRPLSERVGGPVALKCENLQRTGSFKIRGAYVRIARLSDAERAHGVVAASAGNHAQGVALAAKLLAARTTVFM